MDRVELYGVTSSPRNRLQRMICTTRSVYKKALSLHGDIYHFHDPELIPFGFLLKFFGKRVVYDVHEDYSVGMLDRSYLPTPLRRFVGNMLGKLENLAVHAFDGIVTATPKITSLFENVNVVEVRNFPLMDEVETIQRDYRKSLSESLIVYIGSISESRGLFQMLEAIDLVRTKLNYKLALAGIFSPADLTAEACRRPGWEKTTFLGWQSRSLITAHLAPAKIGLVTLHPTPGYLDSYPVKLFEYMGAGLPVIASDFPLWRQIVENAGCGLLVDPLQPESIAEAIDWLFDNPIEAEEMGRRGRQIVKDKYNWSSELTKLVNFYDHIMTN